MRAPFWCEQIRFDLGTIVVTGGHRGLIQDEDLILAVFQAELDPLSKADKRTFDALSHDKAAVEARVAETDALLEARCLCRIGLSAPTMAKSTKLLF